MKKILKNESGSDINLITLGLTILNSSQVELIKQVYSLAASPLSMSQLTPLIESGDIVVNNGEEDLPIQAAIVHIANIEGIERSHTDITLLPGVGDNAASFVEIDEILAGHQLEVNERIYGQSRVDNWVGGDVTIEIHLLIDNDTADRWAQFEIRFRTTVGYGDKVLNTADDTITIGPTELPTTPFMPFVMEVNVPESYFNNEEKYILFQIKRVTATGKTAPTNDPIIWRYCKVYYKEL